VAQAAELVVVVLEGVRVDRAQPHPELLGVRAARESSTLSHGMCSATDGARPVYRVHLRRVGDLLERVARHARLENTLKRVPELPNAHDGSSMASRDRSAVMSAKVVMHVPLWLARRSQRRL
jgi:hypothetical protein